VHRAAAHAVRHFGDVFGVQMQAPAGWDRTMAEHEARGAGTAVAGRGAGAEVGR
jgi:hypothetical protein